MGIISSAKVPKLIKKRDGNEPVKVFKQGGKIKKLGTGGMFGIIPEAVQSGSLPRLAGYAAGPIAGEWYKGYKSKKDAEEAADEAKAKGGMKRGGKVKKLGLGGILDPIGANILPTSITQSKYYDPLGDSAGMDTARNKMLDVDKEKANAAAAKAARWWEKG